MIDLKDDRMIEMEKGKKENGVEGHVEGPLDGICRFAFEIYRIFL